MRLLCLDSLYGSWLSSSIFASRFRSANLVKYISVPENGYVELTASASLKVTKTIDDPEVQAGGLDILLVPGPEPSAIFEEPTLKFLQKHATWKGSDGKVVDILSVCTGAILLGQSGVLKGKQACGPRALVPMLRKKFPDVNWVDDKRWFQDGNIWTSGKFTGGAVFAIAAKCIFYLLRLLQEVSPMAKRWSHPI